MSHDTAGCFGKISYPTRADAKASLRCVRERRGSEEAAHLRVYHCRLCARFHIGRDRNLGRHERAHDDAVAKLKRYLALTGQLRGN